MIKVVGMFSHHRLVGGRDEDQTVNLDESTLCLMN
jgi:hypothetical protein